MVQVNATVVNTLGQIVELFRICLGNTQTIFQKKIYFRVIRYSFPMFDMEKYELSYGYGILSTNGVLLWKIVEG